MKSASSAVSLLLTFLGYTTSSYATEAVTPKLFTCNSAYALCDNTTCTKDEDGKTANCSCPVYHGNNTGGTLCSVRKATALNKNSNPSYVYSDYSPIHLLTANKDGYAAKQFADPILICKTGANYSYQYTDCFDVKCTMENESTASCQCPIKTGKNSVLMLIDGANCLDSNVLCKKFTSSDSAIAVNSAPVVYGTYVTSTSIKSYGATLNKSMFCTPTSAT